MQTMQIVATAIADVKIVDIAIATITRVAIIGVASDRSYRSYIHHNRIYYIHSYIVKL